jgi:gamma-glutamyltranspeptidase/glutathione hydrolase
VKTEFIWRIVLLLVLADTTHAWAAQPVRARHGMVVTVEPHATDVGVNVLKSGGNAVDAAVAVGFALAVTHPSAGNVGGGGFMLVRMADGRTTLLDFRERAPQAASRNMYIDPGGRPSRDSIEGYRAAGVPGTVRGLEYAWHEFGTKIWAELVHPAEELASSGYALTYVEATSMRNAAKGPNGAKGLSDFPVSNRIFLRDGEYYESGDTFVQADLGRTLERIAQLGAKDFYEGATAALLAKDMKENGDLITLDDLKNYRVIERGSRLRASIAVTTSLPRRRRAPAAWGLERRGYTVRREASQGQCAAIVITNGWLQGAADSRSGGKAEGY